MPALSTLHNELRLRVPDKPSEFYDDALRWAINEICKKTSLWRVITTVTTVADKDVYTLDLPVDSATHSNLFIIQKGATDRLIKRPVNGFRVYSTAPSDYLQAFKTYAKDEIQIFPVPVAGAVTLEITTAIKPTSSAIGIENDKFFEEYKDTVVYGALFRCFELDDIVRAEREKGLFNNGCSSIKVDVLKENADTPNKVNVGW